MKNKIKYKFKIQTDNNNHYRLQVLSWCEAKTLFGRIFDYIFPYTNWYTIPIRYNSIDEAKREIEYIKNIRDIDVLNFWKGFWKTVYHE